MAFTILHPADAIEETDVGGNPYWPQAQIDRVDFDILAAAAGGVNGVSSGCAVTAQGSPNNTVAVTSGTVVVNGIEVAVSSGNVTMTAAHATLPRFDLITVTNAGVKTYTAGTAAASPVFPAIPANSVVIAAIYVQPTDNVINSIQVVRKDIRVPTPFSVGGWTTVEKSADQGKQNTTTLANDSDLQFALAANGEYRIRVVLFGYSTGGGGIKLRTTGPASPNLAYFHVRIPNSATGLEASSSRIEAAYSATDINWIAAGSATRNIVYFDGIVHNGANAGNFAIQWAQITSHADWSYLLAGSYLEYARVD